MIYLYCFLSGISAIVLYICLRSLTDKKVLDPEQSNKDKIKRLEYEVKVAKESEDWYRKRKYESDDALYAIKNQKRAAGEFFEKEIIHLKDIIQAKDLILKEKFGVTSENKN